VSLEEGAFKIQKIQNAKRILLLKINFLQNEERDKFFGCSSELNCLYYNCIWSLWWFHEVFRSRLVMDILIDNLLLNIETFFSSVKWLLDCVNAYFDCQLGEILYIGQVLKSLIYWSESHARSFWILNFWILDAPSSRDTCNLFFVCLGFF